MVTISEATIELILHSIKNVIIFEKDVQDHHPTQWMNTGYNKLRYYDEKVEDVTSKCVEHIIGHQNYIFSLLKQS